MTQRCLDQIILEEGETDMNNTAGGGHGGNKYNGDF